MRVSALQWREFAEGQTMLRSEYGVVRIYKQPQQGHPYVIGADTSSGTSNDYQAIQVIDNITCEQVAVGHFKYSNSIDFSKQLYAVGRYYKWALIAVENNFDTSIGRHLVNMQYKKIYMQKEFGSFSEDVFDRPGFRTTTVSKPVVIGNLQDLVNERVSVLVDIPTINELSNYQRIQKGALANGDPKYVLSAPHGQHDDLLMALGIALCVRDQQRTTVNKFDDFDSSQSEYKGAEIQWTSQSENIQ
jgi:hypothetical protein